MSTKAFILILIPLLGVFLLIASGIVYSFTHPPEPQTAEQQFTRSCQNQEGVPDTSDKPWKCLGL